MFEHNERFYEPSGVEIVKYPSHPFEPIADIKNWKVKLAFFLHRQPAIGAHRDKKRIKIIICSADCKKSGLVLTPVGLKAALLISFWQKVEFLLAMHKQ